MFCVCVSAQKDGGTQIKLVIDYEDGSQALFKPMRLVGFFFVIEIRTQIFICMVF